MVVCLRCNLLISIREILLQSGREKFDGPCIAATEETSEAFPMTLLLHSGIGTLHESRQAILRRHFVFAPQFYICLISTWRQSSRLVWASQLLRFL
jgi:hypothetical protein